MVDGKKGGKRKREGNRAQKRSPERGWRNLSGSSMKRKQLNNKGKPVHI